MTARNDILHRISAALADRPEPAAIPRDYRPAGSATGPRGDRTADIELFIDRLSDYKANVHRHDDVAVAIEAILTGRKLTRVVVPDGFPTEWLPLVGAVHEPVNTATLDEVSAVITTCAIAVAETGTIVLDAGAGMGPRSLTLVPDYHLVVVRTDQIMPMVPDAIAALDPTRPLTWISGPSATSDIELNRVEGVHGPRTLDVLIVGPTGASSVVCN